MKMASFSIKDQSSRLLQTMYQTRKHTDCILIAGESGIRIPTHKAVLANALDYFDKMLYGNFKEADKSEIVINEIEPDILEAIIKFLYLGVIEIGDLEIGMKLWSTADFMEITELKKYILNYIINTMDSQNCLSIYFFAVKYDQTNLSSKAIEFAGLHLSEIMKCDSFKLLDKNILVDLIEEFKELVDEDNIAEGILTWIEYDEIKREIYFKELLRLLNINLITKKDVIESLEEKCKDIEDLKLIIHELRKNVDSNNNLFKSNPEVILIVQALSNNRKCLSYYNVVTNRLVSENCIQINGTIEGVWRNKMVVLSIDNYSKEVSLYDLQTKEIKSFGSHFIPQLIFSTIINGYLYMFSYFFCIIINLKTGASRSIEAATDFGFDSCAFLNDKLYYIVFDRRNPGTKWIVTYQECDGSWERYKEFTFPSTKSGPAVGHEGCIYRFGDTSLHVYNPKTNEWTQELEYEISFVRRPVSVQGKLYLLKNNMIMEYKDDQIKPVESNLNSLNYNCQFRIFPL